jgi:hypothetical protein
MVVAKNLVYDGHDGQPNFLGTRALVEALPSHLRHYCRPMLTDGPSSKAAAPDGIDVSGTPR